MDDTTLERRLHSARRWNHALLAICILNAAAAGWAIYALRARDETPSDHLRAKTLVLEDPASRTFWRLEPKELENRWILGMDVGRGDPDDSRQLVPPPIAIEQSFGSAPAIRLDHAGGSVVIQATAGGGSLSIAYDSSPPTFVKLDGGTEPLISVGAKRGRVEVSPIFEGGVAVFPASRER